MTNTNVSGSAIAVALPRRALVRQWMTEFHVPAVGIGLVSANRVAQVKVYGELSKGIPAPQNAVWGSRELADAIHSLFKGSNETGTLPLADIFTKLAMPDTAFGDPIAVLSRLTRPHNKRNGIYVFKPYDTENHLFTTVGDFCKLLIYINQQTDMWVNGLPDDWKQLTNPKGIVHRTTGNGASHTIVLMPQQKQALVIFTNSDSGDRVEVCILKSVRIDDL